MLAAAAACAALALLVAGCAGGGGGGSGAGVSGQGGAQQEVTAGADVRLSITPGGGKKEARPDRGITVTAKEGTLSEVIARAGGERVDGEMNAAHTEWHSTWALSVDQNYTVTATAAGISGEPITRTARFKTLTPADTFRTQIVEG
ncbi:MAG: Ig-like domain-containing protein, partial [Syntrophothermus sp.]